MLKSKYERDLHVRRHKILADECAICLEPLGYVYRVHARVNIYISSVGGGCDGGGVQARIHAYKHVSRIYACQHIQVGGRCDDDGVQAQLPHVLPGRDPGQWHVHVVSALPHGGANVYVYLCVYVCV